MADRLKGIWMKVVEWWNHFTTKQKTIIVSVAAGVALAFAILITIITRPQYTLLANCETTKEASEITKLLDDNSMKYEVSTDGLTITILNSQLADANLLLGANDIQAAAYSIDNVTNGGFSTTESDKKKRYQLYLESHLQNDFIQKFEAIKSASVQLNMPEDDGTLIASKEQASVAILLELEGDFTTDNAAFLAKAVSAALGNETAADIVIMDTEGNMLYSGEDDYSISGNASSQLAVKQQAEADVANEVKKVLQGTNGFDNIEVASNLDMDFSTYSQTDHNYTPADGQTQGLYAEANIYNEESTAGNNGVPGTDSNNETTYVIKDNNTQSASTTEEKYKYVPNESISTTETPPGVIKYNSSSIAVTAIDYTIVKESEAKNQGLLDGITWEEYKAANSERTKIETDADLIDVVAKATGMSAENISLVAYSENWFVDNEGLNVSATDIIQIVLIVVILGLLAFVVLRSMRGEKQPEAEPELSVESLLQSTPEAELDDISAESKSETRRVVEKFVDDNPEAVANLLRNWLNEDWG